MTRWAYIRLRATGEYLTYSYKRSWGHTYYSFDNGESWHRTLSAAYRAAEARKAGVA
jgi:hypothetical protein